MRWHGWGKQAAESVGKREAHVGTGVFRSKNGWRETGNPCPRQPIRLLDGHSGTGERRTPKIPLDVWHACHAFRWEAAGLEQWEEGRLALSQDRRYGWARTGVFRRLGASVGEETPVPTMPHRHTESRREICTDGLASPPVGNCTFERNLVSDISKGALVGIKIDVFVNTDIYIQKRIVINSHLLVLPTE